MSKTKGKKISLCLLVTTLFMFGLCAFCWKDLAAHWYLGAEHRLIGVWEADYSDAPESVRQKLIDREHRTTIEYSMGFSLERGIYCWGKTRITANDLDEPQESSGNYVLVKHGNPPRQVGYYTTPERGEEFVFWIKGDTLYIQLDKDVVDRYRRVK